MSADSYVLSQGYLLKLVALSPNKSIFYDLPQLDGLILYIRLITMAMNDYQKLLSSYKTQQWRSSEKSEDFNSRIFISGMILRSKRWVVVELCAVISISFVLKWQWALEPFSNYCSGLNKSRNEEKWHFHYHTLLCLAVFHGVLDLSLEVHCCEELSNSW